MKKWLKKLVLLVIVLLLFTSVVSPQKTQTDSVLISINRLKVANLLFIERDNYKESYDVCTKMVSIKDVTIKSQDTLIYKLETKIENLNYILNSKDDIIVTEREKYKAAQKKYRKDKGIIVGGAGILLILAILL